MTVAVLNDVLVEHCAPVLMGTKCANLINLRMGGGAMCALKASLAPNGLRQAVLRFGGGKALIMIYDEALLEEALSGEKARAALEALGYPEGLRARINHLRRRITQLSEPCDPRPCGLCDEGEKALPFPHEIGFFLGYPPEDVEGFMRHGGRECKLSGPWKVYGDIDKARRLFDLHRHCKHVLRAFCNKGGSLCDIAQLKQYSLLEVSV